VRKDFETRTYHEPFCKERAPGFGVLIATSEQGCVEMQEPFSVPDFLESSLVVPPSGTFEWHMNPSTRPFVGKNKEIQSDPIQSFHQVVEGDGTGAPSAPVDAHERTIPFEITDPDTSRLTLDLEFDLLAEDYDLELCKYDAAGSCEPFGAGDSDTGSSGNPPGFFEHIEAVRGDGGDPLTGRYEARVVNFASATDSWTLTIDAVKPGSVTTVPGSREAWTLTCESPDGTVLAQRELFIDRGQTAAIEFGGACAKRGKKPPPKSKK
jgi:hypothetical protein